MSFASKLKAVLDDKKVSQSELARRVGINRAVISQYIHGKYQPKTEYLVKIAQALNVAPSELSDDYIAIPPQQSHDTPLPPGAIPINSSNSVLIPVLGTVAAGVPIYAEDNIVGYEDIPREWTNGGREYFALQVKGNSMEPKIFEGDIIIIKKQNYIDNGEVAVVLINGDEATVKQVKKTKEGLMLIGFNAAAYSPTLYTPDEVINLPVEIIGKVMELRRQL